MKNIRAYNNMFSFTSIGGRIQSSLNDGGGPPQFVISGQNYHRIGNLLPTVGDSPKFAQLYIYDTQNEVHNRIHNLSGGVTNNLDALLVSDLMEMVDKYNVLEQSFRRVRDAIECNPEIQVSLRLFRRITQDTRNYNLPTVDEVIALIVGDIDSSDCGRDIVVRAIDGQFQRIHETHTVFIPLQYPLLFPYGDDGYQETIQFRSDNLSNRVNKRKRVSLCEFIAFRIQVREVEKTILLQCGRLFQQFVVDCYSMIESQRLSYIRHNQVAIRKDVMMGLEEAVDRGDTDPTLIESRIVLPSSFVGGRRYMFNNCQDAMAICRCFGYPDLFLTVTCNPKWPEIHRYVSSVGLNAYDHPDIKCRIFRIKLAELMHDFKRGEFFGKVNAGMYSIEFQKRGLPHAHILLWLDTHSKLGTPEMIDSVICAELPDPIEYPALFKVVLTYMVHGPCGNARSESPCMRNGRCSKYFPKKFNNVTTFDSERYPIYRRRDSGINIVRMGIELDNRFVVPYNPCLLMKYQAHINIGYCNKSDSIKYLFKYVNKGVDRVTVALSTGSGSNHAAEGIDEIQQYYDCRYLSPCESVWRIFAFDIHHRWPLVQRLTFHLKDQQVIVFKDNDCLDNVVQRQRDKNTIFLAWMSANALYPEGRNLTYGEFPKAFVYDGDHQEWCPRKMGFSIGRMNFVLVGSRELYYLRLLLNVQRGCTSYEDLRTVNGITYPCYRDACGALGLLNDDSEFIDGIVEASTMASGKYLRELFVSLLLSSSMNNPVVVWEKTWRLLAD